MCPGLPSNIFAVTLLFRQFVFQENNSKLSCLQFVPFYKTETLQDGLADPLNAAAFKLENTSFLLPWLNLSPDSTSSLKAIGIFFSTLQDGFLYNVTNKTQFIVPKSDDAVCLLGLRPFLGVDHLVKSDSHLILVSSVEDSVSNTEHSGFIAITAKYKHYLRLEVAECQKSASPNTYYHLLSEVHVILRTEIFFENHDKEIETLYTKSCLMLADYFLCNESTQKLYSIPYYHLSQLSAENIIKRILEFRHQLKLTNIFQCLVFYMDSILFDEKLSTVLSLSQSTADSILSAYSEEAPEMLWKVILCSNFENYKLDKAILILKRRLTNKRQPLSPISNAADTTALVYLLLQKNNSEAAQSMIMSLTKSDLLTIMASIDTKLWDGINLTNFGKFLNSSSPFVLQLGSFTLFFGSRATWLNEMPPFNGRGITRNCLLSPKMESKKPVDTDPSLCCCWNCNEDLLRLQSLLSYLGPPEDIKGLVLDFLCSAKDQIPNWLSVEVMCSNEARAIKLLMGMAPKALLPYATETFKDDSEKVY
ncbi:unnamed protein product [Larinioides sclopetarius]|uniref:BLOC-2 complex member HPS3 C-terminal domain-containing protein n=1 Tax=Larinioides sclopetarius TaxID=280406 RepID=A0AAV2C041_9ARAC